MIERLDPMWKILHKEDGLELLENKINEIIAQVNLITKSLEGRQFYEQEKK